MGADTQAQHNAAVEAAEAQRQSLIDEAMASISPSAEITGRTETDSGRNNPT